MDESRLREIEKGLLSHEITRELIAEVRTLTKKGESLCQQNGELLMEVRTLRGLLANLMESLDPLGTNPTPSIVAIRRALGPEPEGGGE